MIKSMPLSDLWIYNSSIIKYTLGTFSARILIPYLGKGSKIHSSVKYRMPSKIKVGNLCEIREGTSLDARSSQSIAIDIGDGCRIKEYVTLASYGKEIIFGKNVLVG